MFRKRKGIHIPYNKQGLIYFTCMNFKDMPQETKSLISELCDKIGKEDSRALYEVLTNDRKSVLSVSLEYHITEKKLYRMRKEFYEAWESFQFY